jgi:DNA-binding response OmpR family regulator
MQPTTPLSYSLLQNVLIIEDDPDMRDLITIMLDRLNVQPLYTDNGKDGYRMAMEHQPAAILLDILLPGPNGYDTCRSLRAGGYTGKIILMSAYAYPDKEANSLACGADEFMPKPLGISCLREALTIKQNDKHIEQQTEQSAA